MKSATLVALGVLSLCPPLMAQVMSNEEARMAEIADDEIRQAEATRALNAMNSYVAIIPSKEDLAAIAAHNARYPDIIARVDAEYKANWDRENPFKPSWEMPKTPQDYYDTAIKDAQTKEQSDLQAKIDFLQKRIEALEGKKPDQQSEMPVTHSTPEDDLRARQRAHEYAVQAEVDRQRRNAQVADPSSAPQGTEISEGEAAYNRAFDKSEAEAAQLYDFAHDPVSVGGKRMQEIESALLAKNDPIYYDPNKPLIIARMVAAEMHVAAKTSYVEQSPVANSPQESAPASAISANSQALVSETIPSRSTPTRAPYTLKEIQDLAQSGDSDAQYDLGVRYNNGDGVPMSGAEAVKWFSAAAKQGDLYAADALGSIYEQGDGVPRDPVVAMVWYRKAAEQDYDSAEYSIGLMYRKGEGVEVDNVQAVVWFTKAALQGYVPAECDLGIMYSIGKGVPKDEIQGLAWTYLAAATGDDFSIKSCKRMESRLGREGRLAAQQKCKELEKHIVTVSH